MKTFLSSLVVIAFFVVIGIGFVQGQKLQSGKVVNQEYTTPTNNNIENPNISAEQLCFIWNTEAGDSMKLSMDIRGSEVIGEVYFLPAEKDKKTGVFSGVITDNFDSATINGWWKAMAEGVTNVEEIKIIIGEGMANVGFGEMKDRGDGVYIYANPENLSYEPNLSQTDCGDEAMD